MKKTILYIILISIIILITIFISSEGFKENNYYIKNEYINDLKIIHLSDLLIDDDNDFILLEDMIKKINDKNADILIFTGNLINKNLSNNNQKKLINILNKIKIKDFKYYVLGDKDNDISTTILNNCNFINISDNYKYFFNNENNPILISTLDENNNLIYDENNTSFSSVLLLIDNPSKYLNYTFDKYTYIFAGHTLGGEIRIPFYGGIILDKDTKKYNNDYYKNNNKEMYISYGIGKGNTKLRIFNKPSYNVYNFIKK